MACVVIFDLFSHDPELSFLRGTVDTMESNVHTNTQGYIFPILLKQKIGIQSFLKILNGDIR